MARATKKNRATAEMIMREYPKLEKYFTETEECNHYKPNKCDHRRKCKYCQNNDIYFLIPFCKMGKGYDYDGTPFGGKADPEIAALMKQYPELFRLFDCADCCGCSGW